MPAHSIEFNAAGDGKGMAGSSVVEFYLRDTAWVTSAGFAFSAWVWVPVSCVRSCSPVFVCLGGVSPAGLCACAAGATRRVFVLCGSARWSAWAVWLVRLVGRLLCALGVLCHPL